MKLKAFSHRTISTNNTGEEVQVSVHGGGDEPYVTVCIQHDNGADLGPAVSGLSS